jgi:ABC-type multidrug transport system ATPase subunit
MYARIKGVPAADAAAAAAAVIASVGLSRFATRPCGEYSGGNKRKLSLAVALIGGPQVLLLDEPSSGMCPLGRRMMWDTIERAAAGLTVVLTTHAMDECEALCERIGVMSAGRLRCLGSVQHLKGRFGEGYVLDVKVAMGPSREGVGPPAAVGAVRPAAAVVEGEDAMSNQLEAADADVQGYTRSKEPEAAGAEVQGYTRSKESEAAGAARIDAVTAAVTAAVPAGACHVIEHQAGRVKIRIKSPKALARAFEAVEQCRADGLLENYAVTQSSLEDVFIKVCKR